MGANNNFATWNGIEKGAYVDLTVANTKALGNTGADACGVNTSIGVTSGKYYIEMRLVVSTSYPYVGIGAGSQERAFNSNNGHLGALRYQPGGSAGSLLGDNTGSQTTDLWGSVTLTQTNVSSAVTGDIIGMALDYDNKKLWFSKNGTFFNSGNPQTGAYPQITWTTNPKSIFFMCFAYTSTRGAILNAGQDSTFGGLESAGSGVDDNGFGNFKYSPPTGYLALCSGNVPTSSDIDPMETDDDYPAKNFNPIIYTGNSTTGQSLTGLGFKPDLIWAKMRNSSQNNQLYDSSRMNTRGTPTPFGLRSDTTGAEFDDQSTGNTNPIIASFDTDGFTLGTSGSGPNDNARTYVAWCWKANGGTTATNNEGNLTSTVQANTKAGFSIMTFGNYTSASGATIGHGLGKAPSLYFHKSRASSGNWHVYHSSLGATKAMLLNSSNSVATAIGYWANTEPTSTVLSLGNTFAGTGNGVVYAWSEIEGFSSFGTYIGSGNSNGAFIYTGFRPAMYFVKNATASNGWFVYDKLRDGFNGQNDTLSWQSTSAEDNTYQQDILSNGFKVRDSNNATNQSGQTFIYGAWADVPFKTNNSR